MSELMRSIYATLYERSTSPFWGTFVVSWSVWNWRIIYLTLFVSEKIQPYKIEYISCQYINWIDMLVIPLLSTVIAIGVIPYVSNWAYWASLEYKKKRRTMKEDYEKGRILTFEESAKIINDLNQSEEKFLKIIAQKEGEIATHKQIAINLNNEIGQMKMAQILIVSATYGYGEKRADVKEIIIRNINTDENRISMRIDNTTMMSDPSPGTPKRLELDYSKDGRVKHLSISEGDNLQIPE